MYVKFTNKKTEHIEFFFYEKIFKLWSIKIEFV